MLAGLFALISFTPSLLPRTVWQQLLATGLTMIAGYAIGAAASRLLLAFGLPRTQWDRTRARVASHRGPIVLVIVILFGGGALWSMTWQGELRAHMGIAAPLPVVEILFVPLGAAGLLALAIGLARVVIALWRRITRFGTRWLPILLARLGAAVAVVAVAVLVINGMLMNGVQLVMYNWASRTNADPQPHLDRPDSALVSGSPSSTVSWESLGAQGRMFISRARSAEELSERTGEPATTPIRVYSGFIQGEDPQRGADRVLAELERTGAFERSVLMLFFTTGTGWVNEPHPAAVEHFTGGDSAVAAMQYSALPSAGAFLFERDESPIAARALFETVHDRWMQLPEDERPMLVLGGESLGAFGGLSAFAGAEQLAAESDGSVWTGPPSFTPFWRQLMAEREPGTSVMDPEWVEPHGVDTVRGVEEALALAPGSAVDELHLLLQHPSDPVVWWNPALLWNRPDWLGAHRDEAIGLHPEVTWVPVVTFWQVTVDLPIAGRVPDGFGHTYHSSTVASWGRVLGAEGATIAEAIEAYA